MMWLIIKVFLGLVFLLFAFAALLNLITAVASFKKPKKYKSFLPRVSLLFKTWNDGPVVERKIKNALELDYPKEKYEIIIADNASSDQTERICRKYEKQGKIKYFRVDKELPEFRNRGQLLDNAIKQCATGEIIVETDIDGICSRNWLREMVKPYADPGIKAVTGPVMCGNWAQSWLTRIRALEDFWFFCTSMYGRFRLTGQGFLYGGCKSYRKSVLDEVGGHGNQTLVEDAELAGQILEHRGRIAVVDAAPVIQEEVASLKQYFDERKRWIEGDLDFSKKYSKQLLMSKKNALVFSANFTWDAIFLLSLLLLPLSSFFAVPIALNYSALLLGLIKLKAKSTFYLWSAPYIILGPALQFLALFAVYKDRLLIGGIRWKKIWHSSVELTYPVSK